MHPLKVYQSCCLWLVLCVSCYVLAPVPQRQTPFLNSSSSVPLNQLYRGATATSTLKAADAKARRNFTYSLEYGDRWRSHASEALANRSWTGDCDDLASTAADIALQMGIPKRKLWFAIVSANRNGRVDHMIAIAEDQDGVKWVIGDTAGPAYKMLFMEHDLLYIHNLTWPIIEWQEMKKAEMLRD